MHSQDHWGGTPHGPQLGERVAILETEVRHIHEHQLPGIRSALADHEEWLEGQDQRISELETNERVKGGVLKALVAFFSSPLVMAVGRVALGAGMLALATLPYVKSP